MKTLNYFILYWKLPIYSLFIILTACLVNNIIASPIYGVYLMIYILLICGITMWISFTLLQNFLQQNKPLNLKLEIEKYTTPLNTSCVKQLTSDVDKYFIYKWFIYISNDSTFNDESRLILQEVIQKMLNVQMSLDKKTILHSVLNLYLKHLKEFRRGLKRKEKYGGNITQLYRYTHSCSNSPKAKNYLMHQLTINLLNHFMSWELSNSLPYRILVSIISKKVVLYLLNLLSNPEFINYLILSVILPINKRTELELAKYKRIKLINVMDIEPTPDENNLEPIKSLMPVCDAITKESTEIIKETTEIKEIEQQQPVEIKKEVLKVDTYDLKAEEVKIYEPKSFKTWYDSYDLESVTLGQDILSMIEEPERDIDVPDGKDEISPLSSAKSILDEMKHMTTIEGLKTSIKPISDVTLHNIKDFQESTVNNVVKPMSQATSTAFHRIGGLHLQDEAAGVVEGILDFGRTKIRKGLRLTGLQDNIIDDTTFLKPAPKRNIVKMPRVRSQEKTEEHETAWINPLQEEIKMEVRQESEEHILHKVPSILTQTHDDSPEPEYEEAADLATSIAKLRSLLEQKTSESGMSTPAVSPMPTDDFANKILLDDGDETDGMMPSFYKFCAKTATGVIHNTLKNIKTALPGNTSDFDKYDNNEKWLFIEAAHTDNSLFVKMDKLLCERKVFCTVDTAYEAIDSLLPLQHDKLNSNIQFEDELDDFEVKVPITKVLLDILSELLADRKDTKIVQEPVIKSILLLFGNYIDESVISKTNAYINYWCASASIPEENNVETLEMDFENFIDIIQNNIPEPLKCIAGENVLKHGIKLFTSSLQIAKINQDFIMQFFEIICLKLMEGSKHMSPVSA